MIIVKEYSGRMWKYDTNKELYFNEFTNKWVKRPYYQKGKFIGKNIGKSIGKNITTVKDKNDKIVEGFHTYDFNIKYSGDIEIQERMNIFLTNILYKYRSYTKRKLKNELFDMDSLEFENDIYIYFSYAELILLLGVNYFKNILKWLIEEDYIKEDIKYNKYKDNLYTFIPTNKLLSIKVTVTKTTTLRVYNSLMLYHKKVEKKLGDKKFMFDIMSQFNIDITEEQFNEIIKNKYPNYIKEKINKKEKYVDIDKYLDINKLTFENIKYYNKLTKFERLDKFNIDTFSGRFHSIFTQIPSECRKYIKLKKEHINIEIDLRQSQISCLSKLLLNEIGENNFTTDCNNNDMYLLMKDNYDLESREVSKKFMFNILFGKPFHINNKGIKYISNDYKKFKQMYPGAAEYIIKEKLKPNNLDKQWSIIAQKLQHIEVDMFNDIWKELKRNKIKFVSIHDSIIVNDKDKELTIKIMNNIMTEKLKGINYELKINNY